MYKELVLLYLIWGCNWSVMRVSNVFFSPLSCAMWRFCVGGAVLAMVIIFLKKSLPERRFWPWIFLMGAFQIAYNNVAIQMSISDLGAGVAAVINYCMPLWMAILAHFCLEEKLTSRKILGIITSIIGIAMLTGFQIGNGFGLAPLLWSLSSSLVWAISGIILKTKLRGCDVLSLTAWQMIVGAVILVIVCQILPQPDTLWTLKSVSLLAYNGVLASALAFLLWMHILGKMEAAKAGAFVLMVPVVGPVRRDISWRKADPCRCFRDLSCLFRHFACPEGAGRAKGVGAIYPTALHHCLATGFILQKILQIIKS